MNQESLLSIISTVHSELGFPVPSAVITSTDKNVVTTLAFVRSACKDIHREHDWNDLVKSYSFSTVDNQQTYTFPSDYGRGIEGTMWDLSNRWPVKPVTSVQWQILTAMNLVASPFERIKYMQNKMWFYPIPGGVYNLSLLYVSSDYVQSSAGTAQSDFEADSDICLFDSQLVTYLVKYKWYAKTGTDTTAVLADYQRTLALCKGQDKVAPRLSLLPQRTKYISTQNYPDGNWVTSSP